MAMKLTNQKKTSEVSLLLTDDKEIKMLNEKYRNISGPTDVLAFSQVEVKNNLTSLITQEYEYLLGDIVISVETAQRQAKNYGHSLQYELTILLIHGFLHLLGFDHNSPKEQDKMKKLEKEIIDNIVIRKND